MGTRAVIQRSDPYTKTSGSEFLFGGGATHRLGEAEGDYGDMLGGYLSQRIGRNTENRVAFDPSAANAMRTQQQGLSNRFATLGNGQAVGAGEMAVNRQVGQAQAQQQAALANARGANAALAMRQAANQNVNIGTAAAGQAAQAQMQDQAMYQGQRSGLLNNMRGQDQTQQNAYMQNQQLNDAAMSNYLAQMMALDQNTFDNRMKKEEFRKKDKGVFAGLLQAGGSMLGSII